MGKPAYRADIDGLRALAVLPVVLYHAGVAGFSGGFVGVDIFFVISGFLITGIIAREVDEKRFSIWHFYERRARRILPALFAMVGFVLVAASVLYLPGDFEDVPKSALAALFFMGNIWFFSQTGYFQGAAETMPLLHTWSLGVEEQFYIVFPLGLVLIAAITPRWRSAWVVAGFLLSLALSVLWQEKANGINFYMLPPRAWELLAGSILALGIVPQIRSHLAREIMAVAGVGLIAFAVFTYDRLVVFPGVTAIPPVLGAALLLYAAPATIVGRVLSLRPLVWIGLISYSLYLWHWPLIVFTQYYTGEELGAAGSIAILALSIVVSWASLRLIETPWRNRAKVSPRAIAWGSVTGLAGLGLAALVLAWLAPWPSRFDPQVARLANAAKDYSPARAYCLRTEGNDLLPQCVLGASVEPDTVVWGDSHAVEYAWVLGKAFEKQDRALVQRTLGSCAPTPAYFGPVDLKGPGRKACRDFVATVDRQIRETPSLGTIYLSGLWVAERYGQRETLDALETMMVEYERLGKRVVFIGPEPLPGFDVPRTLALSAQLGRAVPETSGKAEFEEDFAAITRRFDRWRELGIEVIEPANMLMRDGQVITLRDGVPLYFDTNHLTLAGARLVLEHAGEIDKGEAIGADRDNR